MVQAESVADWGLHRNQRSESLNDVEGATAVQGACGGSLADFSMAREECIELPPTNHSEYRPSGLESIKERAQTNLRPKIRINKSIGSTNSLNLDQFALPRPLPRDDDSVRYHSAPASSRSPPQPTEPMRPRASQSIPDLTPQASIVEADSFRQPFTLPSNPPGQPASLETPASDMATNADAVEMTKKSPVNGHRTNSNLINTNSIPNNDSKNVVANGATPKDPIRNMSINPAAIPPEHTNPPSLRGDSNREDSLGTSSAQINPTVIAENITNSSNTPLEPTPNSSIVADGSTATLVKKKKPRKKNSKRDAAIKKLTQQKLIQSKLLESTNQALREEKARSIEDLRKDNITMKLAKRCVICQDSDANKLFVNCGHLVCCDKCSPAVDRCPHPTCGKKICGVVTIFYG